MTEGTDQLSPTRLTLARKMRGKTMTETAQLAGVSRQSISAYENARQTPTIDVLKVLAHTLSVPVTFLTAGEVSELSPESVSFRSLSRLPARTRDRAIGAAVVALQMFEWFDRKFVLPDPDIPDWHFVDPETAADSLRAAWGLGTEPAPSLIHLLESRGVRVFAVARVAENWPGLDALSFWHGVTPHILVNTSKPPSRLRMSLAHELGHLVLHQNAGSAASRDAEREAMMFGAAFLLPRESLIASGVRTVDMDALLDLKSVWGASIAAIARRLFEIGLLPKWQYRLAFIEINSRGWRKTEPGERSLPVESSQLLHKVLTSLRSEGITRSEIARRLCLYVDDLNEVLSRLVPTTTLTPHEADSFG